MRPFEMRAANACLRAMDEGCLSERHIRDVLKCRTVEVDKFEKFLNDGDSMVRLGAARILCMKDGDISKVIGAMLNEEDKSVLIDMIMLVGDSGRASSEMAAMLLNDDNMVRDEAIEALRRTGRADDLLPLIFEKDDALVERVKRYMYEQEK